MGFDSDALSQILNPTTGTFTIAGLIALGLWRFWNGLPAVMAQWIAWRQTVASQKLAREQQIHDAKHEDWTRLRDEVSRIDNRCKALEEENHECRQNLAAAIHRIAQLEGYQLGRGQAAQEAQRFESTQRIVDDKVKKDGGDGC